MANPRIKADPGTHRDKMAVKTRAGQERKQKYLRVKEWVVSYEKENYTQLVVMKAQDGKWWKMFGHSAVFYKYMVAKRMRFQVKLLPDTDYNFISKQGVVSVRDIDELKDKLKPARIYVIKTTPSVVIFDLGERVSEQDYNLMLNEDELRLKMANKLIVPEERMTELNAKTKAMHRIIHDNVRKMDGASREAFGVEMEKRVVQLQILVIRAARGTVGAEYCLKRAYELAEDLYGYAMILMNLRLLEAKKVYDITEVIVALEAQVKKEMRKRAMDKADIEVKEGAKEMAEEEDVEKTEK